MVCVHRINRFILHCAFLVSLKAYNLTESIDTPTYTSVYDESIDSIIYDESDLFRGM